MYSKKTQKKIQISKTDQIYWFYFKVKEPNTTNWTLPWQGTFLSPYLIKEEMFLCCPRPPRQMFLFILCYRNFIAFLSFQILFYWLEMYYPWNLYSFCFPFKSLPQMLVTTWSFCKSSGLLNTYFLGLNSIPIFLNVFISF